MKKLTFILLTIIFILLLYGCTFEDPKYIHLKKKPSTNSYTTEIAKNLSLDIPYSLELFNLDLYKLYILNDDEKKVLINFLKTTTTDNFNEYEKISDIETYQLRMTFSNGDKYIIKVFNNSLLSVSPWDGIFSEDIINMNNIPANYNLYEFCIFIEKKRIKENSL